MAHDYTALDAAILYAIKNGAPALFSLLDFKVRVHSAPLAHTDKQGQAWRVVDRRLQALRKAGRIRYQRKPEGWVLVTDGP